MQRALRRAFTATLEQARIQQPVRFACAAVPQEDSMAQTSVKRSRGDEATCVNMASPDSSGMPAQATGSNTELAPQESRAKALCARHQKANTSSVPSRLGTDSCILILCHVQLSPEHRPPARATALAAALQLELFVSRKALISLSRLAQPTLCLRGYVQQGRASRHMSD